MKQRVLQDYKVCSVYAIQDGGKPEWEAQLNCYAYMLHQHDVEVHRLEVVAILRDWRKAEALRRRDYPQQQVLVLDVPLWTPERAEQYLRERVVLHQAAERELPACTPEERWQREAVWAVTKVGNKRATSLHASPAEAEAAAAAMAPKVATVEYRPGIAVRCSRYCAVRRWCEADGQFGDGELEPIDTDAAA